MLAGIVLVDDPAPDVAVAGPVLIAGRADIVGGGAAALDVEVIVKGVFDGVAGAAVTIESRVPAGGLHMLHMKEAPACNARAVQVHADRVHLLIGSQRRFNLQRQKPHRQTRIFRQNAVVQARGGGHVQDGRGDTLAFDGQGAVYVDGRVKVVDP